MTLQRHENLTARLGVKNVSRCTVFGPVFNHMIGMVGGRIMPHLGRFMSGLGGLVCALALPMSANEAHLAWDDAQPAELVTGYTIHYGTISGEYTDSVTVNNVTTGTVSNLRPGTTYYFSVSAFSEDGDHSALSEEYVWQAPGQPEYAWIEAELFEQSDGFVHETATDASGGGFILSPLGGQNHVGYDVNVEGGQYYVWALVRPSETAEADGQMFYGSIDGGDSAPWRLSVEALPGHENCWTWGLMTRVDNGNIRALVDLGPGPHTLELRNDGGVLIDVILLTSDPGYAPPPATARSLRTSGAFNISESWRRIIPRPTPIPTVMALPTVPNTRPVRTLPMRPARPH